MPAPNRRSSVPIVAVLAIAAVLSAPLAQTEEITFLAEAGRPVEISLPAHVNDENLADPSGYFPPENRPRSLVRTLSIENPGKQSSSLEIILNGKSLSTWEQFRRTAGLHSAADLPRLFRFWCDARFHATTGTSANRHPMHVLRAYGFTFCGDDARALGAAMHWLGVEARLPRLHGHSVAEFKTGDRWTMVDGDQQVIYYQLDNQTPASAQDVVEDPFLALRSRIYGKQASWSAAQAWLNASRFERIEPVRERTLKTKQPPEPVPMQLLPGEKIVFHYGTAPDFAGTGETWKRHSPKIHALVELHLDREARRREGVPIQTPYPMRLATKPDVFDANSEGNPVEAFATIQNLPRFQAGKNRVELPPGSGPLHITIEPDPDVSRLTPAPVPVVSAPHVFDFEPPHFVISANADRIWWQIAMDEAFLHIPSNLESLGGFRPDVAADDLISQTFFASGGTYYFRAKVRSNGVWSGWSKPHSFEIRKPDQPKFLDASPAGPDAIRLRWKPSQGDMLVFGSDRLDFLPEIYTPHEPVCIENGAVKASHPNKNLLMRVPGAAGLVDVPARAFYRLIITDRAAYSVPSPIIHNPGRKGSVLQNRHIKDEGALVGTDIATVVPLP